RTGGGDRAVGGRGTGAAGERAGRAAPPAADRARASGAQRHGRRQEQRGDRPGAVRLRGHREDPCPAVVPQARRPGPGARGRVRVPVRTGHLNGVLFTVFGERVVHAVGVAPRVLPGHVVVRVGARPGEQLAGAARPAANGIIGSSCPGPTLRRTPGGRAIPPRGGGGWRGAAAGAARGRPRARPGGNLGDGAWVTYDNAPPRG